MSKVIIIEHPTEGDIPDPFDESLSIAVACNEIRSSFELSGGSLKCNGVTVSGDALLSTLQGELKFVRGRAADQPLQDDQLVAKLSNLELGLHQIINQLPASVVHIKLTPSLATVAKDVGFKNLMDALDLDFPTMIEEKILEEGNFSNFEFDWVWGQKKENESYEPFQKAYAEHSLPGVVVCVSDGERLMNKLLFTTPLWSLRKFDEKQRKFGTVLYRGEISGRTDLVLMDYDPGADILRHNVKVAIEVKRNCDINAPAKLKSALREATTQLLGLCGDNSNNTPPVILTDFTSLFIVLQLHVKSNYPLKFEILAWNCSNIKSTLHKASMVSMLPCVSADFGRPDTPSGSDGDLEEFAGLKVTGDENDDEEGEDDGNL